MKHILRGPNDREPEWWEEWWAKRPVTEGILEVAFAISAMISAVVLVAAQTIDSSSMFNTNTETLIGLTGVLIVFLLFPVVLGMAASYYLYLAYLKQSGLFPKASAPLKRLKITAIFYNSPYGWMVLAWFFLEMLVLFTVVIILLG